MGNEKKLSSIERRLILFSTVIRLGHEAFKKGSVNTVILHILNHSRSLLPYDRSAFIDCRSGDLELTGVMGESGVKQDSEYCLQLKKLFPAISELREAVILNEETFAKNKLPQKSLDAFRKHFGSEQLIVLPLAAPNEKEPMFYWIVEFMEPLHRDDILMNLFSILSVHYGEALCYRLQEERGPGKLSGRRKGGKRSFLFGPQALFLLIIAVFVYCLFYVKVPIQAVADFEFKPTDSKIVYAPYAGAISKVFFDSGQEVEKTSLVLEYNTEELLYDLAIEQKKLAETLTELDLVKTQSFDKVELRGRIKILDLRRQLEENRIKKHEWYLTRSKVTAQAEGTLVIGDRHILTGKKVQAGEKLFEVVSENNVYAEVYLNEKDAIVLGKGLKILLYPHIKPEEPIPAKVISISPVPLRNDNRQFTYLIKVIPERTKDFTCGMRGIANLSSQQVTLGYYLFRSVIIWWRKL